MNKGLFITFEGIDGCGKTTQFQKVTEFLKDSGTEFIVVREPGGTEIGEKIRNILLDKKNSGMHPVTELFLYEAARAQIVSEKIEPALQNGISVLCDRFYDSTYAYQGYARKLGADMVDGLNAIAAGETKPDMTFLLDISCEEALRRRGIRGEEDRLEALGIEFQRQVREGYLELASKYPERIRLIDASDTPENIFEKIKQIIIEAAAGRI